MIMTIGSGDTSKLLMGKNTQGFASLVQKFVSDDRPYWNSLASPIDALRVGSILEPKYLLTLPDDYYCQVKATSKEFDCLVSSLDFAKMDNGNVVDFDEMKTIFLTDFMNIIIPLSEDVNYIEVLKKKFKSNYNQVQFQLLCSGLKEANLVFVAVNSYDDEENYNRVIEENEIKKFRVFRDENVINQIKERAKFFQSIKDFIIEKG